jgi:Uma2 family endonuclease
MAIAIGDVTIPTMQEVVFESTRTMPQEAFEEWVRERHGRDPNRYELLHGRIVMTPPAGYPHGEIAANVVALLHGFVKPRRLGKVFDSSQGFALPTGHTLEPDATFVSKERWESEPPPVDGKYLRVVPDLVVEVLSSGTASRDRGEKKAAYAESGVREYWVVDKTAREVVMFALEGKRYGDERVFADGKRAKSAVLAGLEFEVTEVFP